MEEMTRMVQRSALGGREVRTGCYWKTPDRPLGSIDGTDYPTGGDPLTFLDIPV